VSDPRSPWDRGRQGQESTGDGSVVRPEDVSLRWDHGVADGLVTSAYARVTVNGRIADLADGQTVVFLDVNSADAGFRWSAYYEAEEGAPFNEGEIKWGSAAELEQAKRDSWSEACRYLVSLGYTENEITESISQPGGSLALDLDDDDE
jgi:hypothetical protein